MMRGVDRRARALLQAGYWIAALLVVVPVLDAVTRTWPVRLGEMSWRFGALGIMFNTVVTPLLGLFIAQVVAALSEHGRALKWLSIVTLVGSVGLVLASGLFALDYLQIRASVASGNEAPFDAAAWKATAVGIGSAVVGAVIGISGWRAGRQYRVSAPPTLIESRKAGAR